MHLPVCRSGSCSWSAASLKALSGWRMALAFVKLSKRVGDLAGTDSQQKASSQFHRCSFQRIMTNSRRLIISSMVMSC